MGDDEVVMLADAAAAHGQLTVFEVKRECMQRRWRDGRCVGAGEGHGVQ